jgi:hypothetical protein
MDTRYDVKYGRPRSDDEIINATPLNAFFCFSGL